jgi:hypothetical protein
MYVENNVHVCIFMNTFINTFICRPTHESVYTMHANILTCHDADVHAVSGFCVHTVMSDDAGEMQSRAERMNVIYA